MLLDYPRNAERATETVPTARTIRAKSNRPAQSKTPITVDRPATIEEVPAANKRPVSRNSELDADTPPNLGEDDEFSDIGEIFQAPSQQQAQLIDNIQATPDPESESEVEYEADDASYTDPASSSRGKKHREPVEFPFKV